MTALRFSAVVSRNFVMAQNLYQQGSLRLRKRTRGDAVWEFRYRVLDQEGKRKLKSIIAGTLADFPTEASIRAKLQGLVLAINAGARPPADGTVGMLLDRFMQEEELPEIIAGRACAQTPLRYSTAHSYLSLIRLHVRPRWGAVRLSDVRPLAVQQWLNEFTGAPKSKANIRALLHRLFEKAMLWEMIQLQRNPIDLVEVKGISKRNKRPTVLTPDQFQLIYQRLVEPQRTMVILAQCTGLRVSELLALQWPDFDFAALTVKVTRAVVNGRVDRLKTEYSEDLLPIAPDLAKALEHWRAQSPPSPSGWIFANPVTLRPYYAASIASRYFRKIGEELGISFGWHTFRHTYRSWLDATGAPVGVQQKLMRHAQVATTMNVYGNALMESKRDANANVVRMVLTQESGA